MKAYKLIILFSILSLTAFGKKTYFLSKDEFTKQFNDSSTLDRIYCHNEKGDKVWLYINQNSILTAKFIDKTEKEFILKSIKYFNGEIKAAEFNPWKLSNKMLKYNISSIVSFTLESKNQEYERPYFDLDSIKVLTQSKNDSIKKIYSSGNENVIFLVLKNTKGKDTLLVVENACYSMRFKNNLETEYGVVQKITKDSIIISNSFNQNMANEYKKDFKVYHFAINEISEIKLLKSGGYSYKTIKSEDFQIQIHERKKEIEICPIWYSWDRMTGEIGFYRLWLTERGFSGIKEKEGKPIWYER